MEFFVPGIPAPGGSKRHIGGGRIIEDCKRTKGWRACVALAAMQAGCVPLDGPLTMSIAFWMPRPKGHYRKDGRLKPSAPEYPTTKPDTTKLVRSTEDALKGICWRDDAQVVYQVASKVYAGPNGIAGADIEIKPMI
jgi:Holliday junction resolvase RusA-like endonuclease